MSQQSFIQISQLHYTHSNGTVFFKDLDLSFAMVKTGLIGKNGVGKSTLLRLFTNELQPQAGVVNVQAKLAYLAQERKHLSTDTVADLLGITAKLAALKRILQGSIDPHDYTLLDDDWSLQERIEKQLQQFDLAHISLDRSVSSLSGGELTRILLADHFSKEADFLILDEPTNNLDRHAKQLLYQAIESWRGGLIIVSHDRSLLQRMEQIIDLTTLGANCYGGNYDDYLIQKAIATSAKQQQLHDAKRSLQRAKDTIQTSRERLEQRRSYGRTQRKHGSVDKLSAHSANERSERTQRRLSLKEDSMLDKAQKELQEIRAQIEIQEDLKVELPSTYVPNGKMVLEVENLCFSYQNPTKLIDNFNLKIQGPERIAITGDNGSGKTTLVKLILGELSAQHGTIFRGVSEIRYLDQTVSLLDPKFSILENFQRLNPDFNNQDSRLHLARFLFREDAAMKSVAILSGGEKLRAALACVLMAKQPPQLLILDEPTNHLDLESIAHIEAALACYQGALIVISHDDYFISNIGVTRMISLETSI